MNSEHYPVFGDPTNDCAECGEPWPCPTDSLGDLRAEFLVVLAERDAMAAAIREHHRLNSDPLASVQTWDALDVRLWASAGISPTAAAPSTPAPETER